MLDLTKLQAIKAQQATDQATRQRHSELLLDNTTTQEVIVKSFQALLNGIQSGTLKTEVTNQLREIGTPDALKVVKAINSLQDTISKQEPTDLSGITTVLEQVLAEAKQIPKSHNVVDIPKPIDTTKQLEALEKTVQAVETAIKAQKLHVEAPVVNVPETVVNVDAPDLKPIQESVTKSSKDVVTAVKGIKIPELNTDPVEKLLKKTNKLLEELPELMPSGGGSGSSWPAVNAEGIPQPLNINADGELVVASSAAADIQNVEIINALRALLQQIAVPSWYDPTTNTLRVGTTAVTVSSGTVTTVGTVTNLTNFGTNAADVMARDTSINTWANTVRRTIS